MRRRERPRQRPESHTGRRRPGAGHRSALRRLPAAWRRSPWPSAAGDARGARGPDPTPQADSSERPLRRREARIARPARVRIRRRKPWVLARRRLFGWKVRLLTRCSPLLPGDRRSGPGVPVVRGEWDESPVRAPSETRNVHVGDTANASRASESGRKPALSTIRERRAEGQTRVARSAMGSAERLDVPQRPAKPSGVRPTVASLGATRRCVDEFPPQHPVPRLRMPWRCC